LDLAFAWLVQFVQRLKHQNIEPFCKGFENEVLDNVKEEINNIVLNFCSIFVCSKAGFN
jgi:hypothetical protein